jgi:hypothetical protein
MCPIHWTTEAVLGSIERESNSINGQLVGVLGIEPSLYRYAPGQSPGLPASCFLSGRRESNSVFTAFGATDVSQTSGEGSGRGAGNRTQSLRTRSARTTGILHPDHCLLPKAHVLPYYFQVSEGDENLFSLPSERWKKGTEYLTPRFREVRRVGLPGVEPGPYPPHGHILPLYYSP